MSPPIIYLSFSARQTALGPPGPAPGIHGLLDVTSHIRLDHLCDQGHYKLCQNYPVFQVRTARRIMSARGPGLSSPDGPLYLLYQGFGNGGPDRSAERLRPGALRHPIQHRFRLQDAELVVWSVQL